MLVPQPRAKLSVYSAGIIIIIKMAQKTTVFELLNYNKDASRRDPKLREILRGKANLVVPSRGSYLSPRVT